MANIVCGNGQLFTIDGRIAKITHLNMIPNDDFELGERLLDLTGKIDLNVVNLSKGFRRLIGVKEPKLRVYSKNARRQKWRRIA